MSFTLAQHRSTEYYKKYLKEAVELNTVPNIHTWWSIPSLKMRICIKVGNTIDNWIREYVGQITNHQGIHRGSVNPALERSRYNKRKESR